MATYFYLLLFVLPFRIIKSSFYSSYIMVSPALCPGVRFDVVSPFPRTLASQRIEPDLQGSTLEKFFHIFKAFFTNTFFYRSWGPCNVRLLAPFHSSTVVIRDVVLWQVVLLTLLCFHIIWSKMFLKRLWRITNETLSDTFVKEYERRESGSLLDLPPEEATRSPQGGAGKGSKRD